MHFGTQSFVNLIEAALIIQAPYCFWAFAISYFASLAFSAIKLRFNLEQPS
jgi:hypothetical protein